MSADTKKLKTRIKSVDSTLHLTKAMGLVASSKIRRASLNMYKSREYAKSLEKITQTLTACPECSKSPYMQVRDTDRLRLIVIAGDRGLAGGYNVNVFRLAAELEAQRIYPIGKKACERYDSDEIILAEKFGVKDSVELSKKLCEDFYNGEYDKLGIICTRYVSIMTQEAQLKLILPLEKSDAKSTGILFEPDETTMLNNVILEYVSGTIIAAVRESFASEIAARRCAMDSAEKNASQMIEDLQLEYNRARQGAITQEITEIVAGSGD